MIKIKKTFSLISLFLISITLATVQPVDANEELLTLDMSVHEALANNWVIKAQEDAVQKSIYINNQSEADLRPTFSTSYGYTRLGEINTGRLQTGVTSFKTIDLNTRNNYLWTTTISQPIFTGYALLSANELAKLGIDLEKINLEMEKLNLALQVKQAYFNILKADKALEVAKSAAESLESHVNVAKNYVEAGMSPVNDQLKAEVELANALQQIVRAQNLSQLNRASLNKLLSRPINNPVNIQDILLFDSISPD
ncbi:MAG: TolC family protein, partial [Deltaproteobacteria bacterium]|nr:TolC family protein [Deltaproteobacteria bacterium]